VQADAAKVDRIADGLFGVKRLGQACFSNLGTATLNLRPAIVSTVWKICHSIDHRSHYVFFSLQIAEIPGRYRKVGFSADE
jgi:hypothetical protein